MIRYILTIAFCAISVPLLCADNQAQPPPHHTITMPTAPTNPVTVQPPILSNGPSLREKYCIVYCLCIACGFIALGFSWDRINGH